MVYLATGLYQRRHNGMGGGIEAPLLVALMLPDRKARLFTRIVPSKPALVHRRFPQRHGELDRLSIGCGGPILTKPLGDYREHAVIGKWCPTRASSQRQKRL